MHEQTNTANGVRISQQPKKVRAVALRDAAVKVLRWHGHWESIECRDGARWRCLRFRDDVFTLSLFSRRPAPGLLDLSPNYNYLRALNGRPLVAAPDFLLDIHRKGTGKVASFEWIAEGPPTWRSFRTGTWEAEMLDLPDLLQSANLETADDEQS